MFNLGLQNQYKFHRINFINEYIIFKIVYPIKSLYLIQNINFEQSHVRLLLQIVIISKILQGKPYDHLFSSY